MDSNENNTGPVLRLAWSAPSGRSQPRRPRHKQCSCSFTEMLEKPIVPWTEKDLRQHQCWLELLYHVSPNDAVLVGRAIEEITRRAVGPAAPAGN